MDASDLLAVETLLFTNRIRESQGGSPRAFREFINWGAWCRDLTGIKPRVARPGWCQDYRTADWNDEDLSGEVEKREEVEVKAEARERQLYRVGAAEQLEVFLRQTFPWRQRRCLVVAYVYEFPEYQYHIRASRRNDPIDRPTYLALFDEAHKIVEAEF